MSTPGRNDPCPCGSGKKYKACCRDGDRAAEATVRLVGEAPAGRGDAPGSSAGRIARVWEADVVPIHIRFRESRDARPALAIVGAASFILRGDVLPERPVGPEARARAVADAVLASARRAGVFPSRLHVRDEALARALAPGLEPHGVTVCVAEMPDLDQAIRGVLERLSESPAGAWLTTPGAWAETEASREEIAELHRAAAAFHRARAWDAAGDHEPLALRFDDGRVFLAAVMGAGGIDYGLALYSDLEDLVALYEEEGDADPEEHIRRMRGWSMSVSLEPRSRLDRAMQREVAAAGWEIAGRDAYPMLFGVRIPGQRLTGEHVRIATRALVAVLREICGAEAVAGLADPAVDVEDDGGEELLPWQPLVKAHSIGAEGPGADPVAALSRIWAELDPAAIDQPFYDEDDRVGRFVAHLAAQRLNEAARRLTRHAAVWSAYVATFACSAGAATEFDLRNFLYDWVPLSEELPRDVEHGLAESLGVFFAWLAADEGIRYPWAGAVLNEFDRVREERGPPPEGVARDPELDEWRSALWDDQDERVMLHEVEVPGTKDGWATMTMNEDVARLSHELQRRWLIWYDEEVRAGVTDPSELWAALVARQRAWESTPHPHLDGRTPRDAVLELEDELEANPLPPSTLFQTH